MHASLLKTAGAAWVTGAGRGIGRSLALRLAAGGWTVAASSRTEQEPASLAAETTGLPGAILPFVLDIVDPVATVAAVQRIKREIGPLDLAILNAGTHRAVSAQGFDAAMVKSLVDVNLLGTVNCLSAILPDFIKQRCGKIAVIASVAGYRGLPTAAAYEATKAALINMCEALKPELDRLGVDLTLVNPGFVDTPLTKNNRFPMPFIIPVDKAADIILRGLDKGRFEIVFPWRMAVTMKVFRILPYSVVFWLTRKMLPKSNA